MSGVISSAAAGVLLSPELQNILQGLQGNDTSSYKKTGNCIYHAKLQLAIIITHYFIADYFFLIY